MSVCHPQLPTPSPSDFRKVGEYAGYLGFKGKKPERVVLRGSAIAERRQPPKKRKKVVMMGERVGEKDREGEVVVELSVCVDSWMKVDRWMGGYETKEDGWW